MVVANRCGHGLQIRAIVPKKYLYISERSGTGYIVPIDKTLDEVPEIIISNITNSTTPGIKIVEYKIPAIDEKLKTTGLLKGDGAKNFKKAIYDPAIWSDDKLEKALKEVLEDAINKNDGKTTGW